jgi:serine/threonine protein kinase
MQETTQRADLARDALPDQQIGSYRILKPLGAGGMSSVYRAVHVETGHEVALKILTRSLARNSTLLQRFLREARSVETLEDPKAGITSYWNMSPAVIFTSMSNAAGRWAWRMRSR